MFKFFSRVMHLGDDVLGINARNLEFVYKLNRRKYFPTADDKLIAKEILSAAGVPTPPTLTIFRSHWELKDIEVRIGAVDGFAVKPAQGFGGRGILIVRRDYAGRLTTIGQTGWTPFGIEDLKTHISYILSGLFSLEKLSDRAFLEQLLEPEDILGGLSYRGVPDIRVIMCQGQHAMAMMRLPTQRSRGRSNLHQGAFALGIDMQTGQTTHAVLGNQNITKHPDTGQILPRVKIPAWKDVLEISSRAARCIELGYVGVDIVIDKRLGPVVIELNARPGLTIQLANRKGLAKKLYEDKKP
jgi:alpha-L-glutamate ligase-like protein